jgi:hypothetical protein
MHAKSLKIRLIAVFLVAFVCLNASGAACVAYCQTSETAFLDHPPPKKNSKHCEPQSDAPESPSVNFSAGESADCCPMTVSFVGAPLEQTKFSFETAQLAIVANTKPQRPFIFQNARSANPQPYRGPPLDRRIDRVKHCVIRI